MKIDLTETQKDWSFPKIQDYNHRKIGEYMHDVYPSNFFSFIIDAGARGVVHPWHVPQMAAKNPETKFFALEVDRPYYEELEVEIERRNLKNVITTAEGLGTGRPIKAPGLSSIQTKTLKQIINENSLDPSAPWAFKCDIEGGEDCLLDDPDSENLLRQCTHIGIEFHTPGIVTHNFFTAGRTFFKKSKWAEWISKNLSETHYIFETAHPKCLSPGVATLVLIKKEIIDQDANLFVSNIWRKINDK